MQRITLIFFLAFCLLSSASAANFETKLLSQNWKMVITASPNQAYKNLVGKQLDVTVPSTLHLNLQKHNLIKDPFYGDNLKAQVPLSEVDVKFATVITLDKELDQHSKVKLIFEGIDTYSQVYLNDALLGKTENAFLKYQYDVKQHLKPGNNLLVVQIKSPKPFDAAGQQKDRMPFEYAHTRKACYQYSWDWAPYMNTMGLWLPVTLVFYDDAKIDYIWVRDEKLTQEEAILDIVITLDGFKSDEEALTNGLSAIIIRKDNQEETQFTLKARYNNAKWPISQPKLWWPNGIGEPHVYEFQVFLMKGNQILDKKQVVYGLRTVSLNQQGTNFKISLNGHPIYCKGANYVPPDMMYPRVINLDFKPRYTHEQILNDVVESNFNMLRVWGGGQYQIDEFYAMASKKGIMIFQDFMFSDSIYPGTDAFLSNVIKEITYQVRRLRNYPCIVLWSGNNQILQGIYSWGWGQPRYRENFDKVFEKMIPQILKMESSNLPYISSSPSKGVGNAGFQNGGDVHYWGVWAGGAPFEAYESSVGGFNSQFGTQSLPVWETIQSFTLPNQRNYDSQVMSWHEKHMSRFGTLKSYMNRYAKTALNFQLESYNSGLVHAYAMQIAIKAQRVAKPHSFGTLYWMLNDAWPAISWSSIDYFGRWKAVQYHAKNLYKDIVLYYHQKTNKVIAINDKLVTVKTNYKIQVMDFNGKILFEDKGNLQLKRNQKRELITLEPRHTAGKEASVLIYTQIAYGDQPDNVSSSVAYLRPLKDLQLDPVPMSVKILEDSNELVLSSTYLIKNVYISSNSGYLKLTDNYFDLLPNKNKQVKIINPPKNLKELKSQLTFKSYRQVYDPQPLTINFEN